MPLFEIVRTEKTSPQVLVDLLNIGKLIKKTPVVVGNTVGFGVNRVFFPYGMAALMLLDLGVDLYRIDGVLKAFGMPMGPLQYVSVLSVFCLVIIRFMCFVMPENRYRNRASVGYFVSTDGTSDGCPDLQI